jgi:hypothetical protein
MHNMAGATLPPPRGRRRTPQRNMRFMLLVAPFICLIGLPIFFLHPTACARCCRSVLAQSRCALIGSLGPLPAGTIKRQRLR